MHDATTTFASLLMRSSRGILAVDSAGLAVVRVKCVLGSADGLWGIYHYAIYCLMDIRTAQIVSIYFLTLRSAKSKVHVEYSMLWQISCLFAVRLNNMIRKSPPYRGRLV